MAAPMFSAKQLGYLRGLAQGSGLVTTITIKRRITTDSVYGDDEQVSYTTVATTKGWIFSSPTPVQQADSGSLITVNTYRLYLPVGTDVRAGDQVISGVDAYVVSDTTGESTWLPMLVCSLRKRE